MDTTYFQDAARGPMWELLNRDPIDKARGWCTFEELAEPDDDIEKPQTR